MREERGQLPGGQIISDAMTLWGSIGGDVTIGEGGKLYLRGAIYGDILVEWSGRLHIFGRVTGSLTVKRGAKVIHSGVIGGDVTNLGGRIFIEKTAQIYGKIITKKGETKVASLLPEHKLKKKPFEENKRYEI